MPDFEAEIPCLCKVVIQNFAFCSRRLRRSRLLCLKIRVCRQSPTRTPKKAPIVWFLNPWLYSTMSANLPPRWRWPRNALERLIIIARIPSLRIGSTVIVNRLKSHIMRWLLKSNEKNVFCSIFTHLHIEVEWILILKLRKECLNSYFFKRIAPSLFDLFLMSSEWNCGQCMS